MICATKNTITRTGSGTSTAHPTMPTAQHGIKWPAQAVFVLDGRQPVLDGANLDEDAVAQARVLDDLGGDRCIQWVHLDGDELAAGRHQAPHAYRCVAAVGADLHCRVWALRADGLVQGLHAKLPLGGALAVEVGVPERVHCRGY